MSGSWHSGQMSGKQYPTPVREISDSPPKRRMDKYQKKSRVYSSVYFYMSIALFVFWDILAIYSYYLLFGFWGAVGALVFPLAGLILPFFEFNFITFWGIPILSLVLRYMADKDYRHAPSTMR